MSTGTKRSTGKPKAGPKEGESVRIRRGTNVDMTVVRTGDIAQKGGPELSTSMNAAQRLSDLSSQVESLKKKVESSKKQVESLQKRVVSLERERLKESPDPESRTPEFVADCAEIKRTLGKQFKSVSTRALSAGQVAVEVTDVAFKGLSWMKRRALLEPLLETLGERAFFRVIETHLRTPDETD